MDVYILDHLLRRRMVVDEYESFIWNERWYELGNFELYIEATLNYRQLFRAGTMLAIRKSSRTMVVETIEDTVDEEGRALLKITGRDLLKILEDRIAKYALVTHPRWTFTNNSAWYVISTIFNRICYDGALNAGDKIPNCSTARPMEDDIPFSSELLSMQIEPATLWTIFHDLCATYKYGMRLVRDPVDVRYDDAPWMRFEVYTGNDLTGSSANPKKIIFSPNLDNLSNTSELTSIDDYKNVAYVFSPAGHQIVTASSVDSNVSGFDRKVITVNADDIEAADPDAVNLMIQKGREALAQHEPSYAFDGELQLNGSYVYDLDYKLGDRVELKTATNVVNVMRVSEQIFICDKEGERSYPTLTLDNVIAPDTWAAAEPDVEWIDKGATEYWSTA